MVVHEPIVYVTSKSKKKGKFEIQGHGLQWVSVSGNAVDIALGDITDVVWTRQHRGNQVVVNTATGKHTFLGFKSGAYGELKNWGEENDKKVSKIERNTVGFSWGDFNVKKTALEFRVQDKPVFELPFVTISQSVIQGKNEVSIELQQDDTINPEADTLVEMRIWVPEDEVKEGQEANPQTPVQRFQTDLVSKAELGGDKAKVIAEFDEFNFLVPRGRYEIKMYASHFSLHGKTFNYKILYKSINKMFLLPHNNYTDQIFIMGLDPPVRQGHTTYPYLIISFKKDKHISLKLNLDDKTLEDKYEGLSKTMEGPMHDVVATIFKVVTKKKQIITPGHFKSSHEQPAIRCSCKANEGFLYIMEKSFFFIKKPALYIRHNEIERLEFMRFGNEHSAARTFDLEIELKNGDTHTFTSMNRNEFTPLCNFFKSKKLPIQNLKGTQNLTTSSGRFTNNNTSYVEMDEAMGLGDDSDDGSEGDSDFKLKSGASGSSDDDEGSGYSEGDAQMADTDEDEDDDAGFEDEKPKKTKKRKTPSDEATPVKKVGRKKKDKNAPKKALSSYMFFANTNRPIIKAASPDITFAEMAKKLGTLWKELDEDGKVEYVAMATADKSRYAKEMETYVPPEDEGESDGGKKGKSPKKKKNPVKRGLSSFMCFSAAMSATIKEENPDATFAERGKLMGEKWRAMSEEDKKEYKVLSDKSRADAQVKAAEYEEKAKGDKEDKQKRKAERQARRDAKALAKSEGREYEEDAEERKQRKEERKARKAEKAVPKKKRAAPKKKKDDDAGADAEVAVDAGADGADADGDVAPMKEESQEE